MISAKEQEKINDFREAYRKIINKDNNEIINEIIDALFYNVECNYKQYQSEVEYISTSTETYKYHILQPENGKYSLLDFLINRAISNIDGIVLAGFNGYSHHRVLTIDPTRYNKYTNTYSDEYVKKLILKTNLHETGHAIRSIDRGNDNNIHCSNEYNLKKYPNEHLTNFDEKLNGFCDILGYKYPNMLHTAFLPESVVQTENQPENNSCICNNLNYDEAFVEYFATKYTGLYKDINNFKGYPMGKEKNGKIPVIYVPNHTNGYASMSKFIFHLDNLVSKEAMFKTNYMATNSVFKEFSEKYSKIIDEFWEAHNMPPKPDSLSKFKYLFDSVCHDQETYFYGQNKDMLKNHNLLDLLFTHIYAQELERGNITKEKMKKIAKISSLLSPAIYDRNTDTVKATPVKKWYEDLYNTLSQTISTQELGSQVRDGIINVSSVDEYSQLITYKKQKNQENTIE